MEETTFIAMGLICTFPHGLGGGSECENQHETPGETKCQLSDAGDVQPDAGVKVEPEAAAVKAPFLVRESPERS